MKFDCGKTLGERREDAQTYWMQWQPWFAWYPVRVGSHDCRWLEYVERKAEWVGYACGLVREFTPYNFAYRAANDNNPEARRAA